VEGGGWSPHQNGNKNPKNNTYTPPAIRINFVFQILRLVLKLQPRDRKTNRPRATPPQRGTPVLGHNWIPPEVFGVEQLCFLARQTRGVADGIGGVLAKKGRLSEEQEELAAVGLE
jgi:hypothetical protein